jgi:hypothetical protein
MSSKIGSRAAAPPTMPRASASTEAPGAARQKAEGWIREFFSRKGLDVGAIGLGLLQGPRLTFVAQTRDGAGARSFTGTLDVLRGRVENVRAGEG